MTEAMDEQQLYEQKKHLIKKQACFAKLNDEELDALAVLFTEKHVDPGQTIVTQGDSVDSVYIIVSGTAEVQLVSMKDGQIVTKPVATLGPEQAIGLNETGFYSLSGKRTATVVSVTQMQLLRLSVAAFHGFALAYSRINELMRQNAKNVQDL